MAQQPRSADELLQDYGGAVHVVAGRPRYHLAHCRHVEDRAAEQLHVQDARDDGYTPCGICRPDDALIAAAEADAAEEAAASAEQMARRAAVPKQAQAPGAAQASNPFAPPPAAPPPYQPPQAPAYAPPPAWSYGQQPGYAPQPPGYAVQSPYYTPSPYGDPNAKGRQAMVMGIIACCTWWIPFLYLVTAVPLSILAIVFGVKGRGLASRGLASNPGQALAGVICGSIAAGLSVLSAIIGIAMATGGY